MLHVGKKLPRIIQVLEDQVSSDSEDRNSAASAREDDEQSPEETEGDGPYRF